MEQLKDLFQKIEYNDTNYDKRNDLVLQAFFIAKTLGYETGIRFDPESGHEWYTVSIVLPENKEVSWHLPCTKRVYTGYSTEEKYNRLKKYIGSTQ